MRIPRAVTGSALALSVAACSSATTAPPVLLDRSFSSSGFGISDGSKVGVLMKATRADNGVVRICGAWQIQSNSPVAGRMAENFLYGAKLYLDDVEVMRRLSYFAEIAPGAQLSGKSAKCRDTKTQWQPSFRTAKLHPVYQRRAFSR